LENAYKDKNKSQLYKIALIKNNNLMFCNLELNNC